MKSLYKILAGVTVVALLLFNSCTPTDVVVEDLTPKLTNGSWTFNSVDAGDSFLNGGYKIFYGGNVISFASDGTCTDKLNALNGTGTWFLNSSQTVLTLSISYDDGTTTRNESWNITTISSSELSYSFSIPPNTLKMRYTH